MITAYAVLLTDDYSIYHNHAQVSSHLLSTLHVKHTQNIMYECGFHKHADEFDLNVLCGKKLLLVILILIYC